MLVLLGTCRCLCVKYVAHVCPDLRDPWVSALAVDAVVLQPLVLGVGAVLLQGATVLSFTPNAPEQRVCLQTQTAASSLGVTLVQMDCAGGRKGLDRRREGKWVVSKGRSQERVENSSEKPLYKWLQNSKYMQIYFVQKPLKWWTNTSKHMTN